MLVQCQHQGVLVQVPASTTTSKPGKDVPCPWASVFPLPSLQPRFSIVLQACASDRVCRRKRTGLRLSTVVEGDLNASVTQPGSASGAASYQGTCPLVFSMALGGLGRSALLMLKAAFGRSRQRNLTCSTGITFSVYRIQWLRKRGNISFHYPGLDIARR